LGAGCKAKAWQKETTSLFPLSFPFTVLVTRFLHEFTYIGNLFRQGLDAFHVPSFSSSPRNQLPIHSTRTGFYRRYWPLISAKENDRHPCGRISDPVLVAQKFHF